MYRYLLFSGDRYYPCGGMNDFVGSYSTTDEAIQVALEKDDDWYHIFDSEDHKIFDKSYKGHIPHRGEVLNGNKR